MKLKKLILTPIIMAAFCVSAQAQVSFSSWGRAVITPLAFSGEHSAVSAATSTWGDVPRVGFSANGTAPSGNIGFNLDFDFGWNINTNSVAITGDNAKAWIKPLGLLVPEQYNMLKLTAGFFKEDEFRGKIGASEFGSWLLPNGSKDEDNIFQRFDATAGAHIKLEPLKWLDSPWNGLNIQAAFGSNSLGAGTNGLRAILNLFNNEDNTYRPETSQDNRANYDEERDRKMSALDVYKAMQVGFAYRIPDTGTARFQFIGSSRNEFRWGDTGTAIIDVDKRLVTGIKASEADVIEAAFLYDGLEGLRVDAGMKIPLLYTTKANITIYNKSVDNDGGDHEMIANQSNHEYAVQRPYVIAAGANWTPAFLSDLTVMARTDVSFGGKMESDQSGITVETGYTFDLWLMPSYQIIDNLRAGIDVGLSIHGRDKLEEGGVSRDRQTEMSEYTDMGFGPWVEMGVGGGKMRMGVVVMIPGNARYSFNRGSTLYPIAPKFLDEPVVSFPMSFTYSF